MKLVHILWSVIHKVLLFANCCEVCSQADKQHHTHMRGFAFQDRFSLGAYVVIVQERPRYELKTGMKAAAVDGIQLCAFQFAASTFEK